jgi:uncharacterized protein YceH (UPF0502 family)
VTPRQRAALCVLLLRGAQTLSEIYTRSERLTDFPALDDVRDTLERLIERQPALVVRIPRSAGRREDRYMHLLCGPVDADAFIDAAAPTSNHAAANNDVLERIEKLEAEVAQLRELVAQLSAPRA